jgi:hypothetical protein
MNNQHYALDYITSLFNIQAPTCFGSRVPFSGSFLDPCELLKKQNNYVVNHIMYHKCYVACVPVCCGGWFLLALSPGGLASVPTSLALPYLSPNIITVFKTKRIIWMRHVRRWNGIQNVLGEI